MFRALILLASLVGTAAFAPAAMKRSTPTSSVLKMSYENELGTLPPVGFWDPLGLAKDIDQETFDKYRTAELKHGRVAQLAVLGYIVPEIFKFPGSVGYPGMEVDFADIPNGLSALTVLPAFGSFQIAASIGFWEIFGWQQGESIGDFKFGDQYLNDSNFVEKKTKELQNGRLAMLAAAELLRHDFYQCQGFYQEDHLITGLPFLYGN